MDFKLVLLAAVIFLLFFVTPGCIDSGRESFKDVDSSGSGSGNETGAAGSENNTPTEIVTLPETIYNEPGEIKPVQPPSGNVPADAFRRDFSWNYGKYKWSITMEFSPETYAFYKNRSRHRDYDLFASDPYDDELVLNIVSRLKKAGEDAGFSDSEVVYLVVSFVQSLPYTSDDVTTGFDEYPRFPYETFYDNGGDCEDTSILASALLQEMGYGVVLIELPEHVAVGVKCSEDFPGSYYWYDGSRYCYLETTGENWNIGKIPDEYKDKEAKIIPVYKRPLLDVDFTAKYRYDSKDVYVDVNVLLKNLGSENAQNTKVYAALQTEDASLVWDSIESEYLRVSPEAGYSYQVTNLHAPAGKKFRIYVIAYGDNVVSDESVSEWVEWKKK